MGWGTGTVAPLASPGSITDIWRALILAYLRRLALLVFMLLTDLGGDLGEGSGESSRSVRLRAVRPRPPLVLGVAARSDMVMLKSIIDNQSPSHQYQYTFLLITAIHCLLH